MNFSNIMTVIGLTVIPPHAYDIQRISDAIAKHPNSIPYTAQTYDCDDFANCFLTMSQQYPTPGVEIGRVNIFCSGGGHALNISCSGITCCLVNPQTTPPSIVPNSCFASAGIPSSLPTSIAQGACTHFQMGTLSSSIVEPSPILDPTDKPSRWCSEQSYTDLSSTPRTQCEACCFNIWEANPIGHWYNTCEQWCEDKFGTGHGAAQPDEENQPTIPEDLLELVK